MRSTAMRVGSPSRSIGPLVSTLWFGERPGRAGEEFDALEGLAEFPAQCLEAGGAAEQRIAMEVDAQN